MMYGLPMGIFISQTLIHHISKNTTWISIQLSALPNKKYWLLITGMAACGTFIEGV